MPRALTGWSLSQQPGCRRSLEAVVMDVQDFQLEDFL
jgi:hypothetical protein